MKFFHLGIAALAGIALMPAPAAPGEKPPLPMHAMAMHGEPKYGPHFSHFAYVNPDAPKGGKLRLGTLGTFDTFHSHIAKGNPEAGDTTETLLTQSLDEPFSEYGLIAESMEVPEDRAWVIFTLRKEARWHDGKPITVEDVIWSFDTLTTRGRPLMRFYYSSVAGAERAGPRRVKFTFKERGNRELPLIVGQLPILPRHYWAKRDFEKTTLEPPLGSGPYRVKDFEAGRFVELERVKDYWGKDLAVRRGQYNFDEIRYDYYRDLAIIREAIKAGEIDFHRENKAKSWALDYNIPAVKKGWLIKEEVNHNRGAGMQALVMNTRREIFKNPAVRQALGLVFDFEWTNKNLFYGQYQRTGSYFANSELASRGLPEGQELAVLEPFRGRVPEAVFTTVFKPPHSDGQGWPRDNLRKAFELLATAGWRVQDLRLVNERTGEAMVFEILIAQKGFDQILLPFSRNLKRLGIDASIRLVDTSQYINRIRQFDFDMAVGSWGQSESPGNEQRLFWTTGAADSPGSRNLAGIRDPAVDELVELLIKAPDRESLVARTRALDRVLLHGHYVIPNWHSNRDRILYWNKFASPAPPPASGTATSLWWYDRARAQKLEAAMTGNHPDEPLEAGTQGPQILISLLAGAGLLAAFVLAYRRAFKRQSP